MFPEGKIHQCNAVWQSMFSSGHLSVPDCTLSTSDWPTSYSDRQSNSSQTPLVGFLMVSWWRSAAAKCRQDFFVAILSVHRLSLTVRQKALTCRQTYGQRT
ncbi:hypothetical protein ANAPC5_01445 [Anaplasma phagocytophilum]|nr:hypothetical protein ANAPC5_01445 [Anaplasma phagocytophilum]